LRVLRTARGHLEKAEDILGAFIADDRRVQQRRQNKRLVTQEIDNLRFCRRDTPSFPNLRRKWGQAWLPVVNPRQWRRDLNEGCAQRQRVTAS
jgi:hypothetical protein